jgi:hypothetical protein
MLAKTGLGTFSVVVAILFTSVFVAQAQAQRGRQTRPLITERVDESRLILAGNRRPEVSAENDRGPSPTALLLEIASQFGDAVIYAAGDEPDAALPGLWERRWSSSVGVEKLSCFGRTC